LIDDKTATKFPSCSSEMCIYIYIYIVCCCLSSSLAFFFHYIFCHRRCRLLVPSSIFICNPNWKRQSRMIHSFHSIFENGRHPDKRMKEAVQQIRNERRKKIFASFHYIQSHILYVHEGTSYLSKANKLIIGHPLQSTKKLANNIQ